MGLVDWDWWIGGLKPTLQPTRRSENTVATTYPLPKTPIRRFQTAFRLNPAARQ
ncbi:hypothetical protein NEILACOT_05504 [Neisseria lactamica ATCC 23970]|uniref:Uncharacterized protein n=1 Tax=Neisseria lactamica ATCC 23970 TaxID=546265 RepID=D0WD68_NEILA|nr:hypothetical protein NEILACOT_05504 [Neisseria lactamica ATCC 23970]